MDYQGDVITMVVVQVEAVEHLLSLTGLLIYQFLPIHLKLWRLDLRMEEKNILEIMI